MKICVVGNDERQAFLAGHLARMGFQILTPILAVEADAVVFPIPLSKEQRLFEKLIKDGYSGVIFAGVVRDADLQAAGNIRLFDYTKSEFFAQLNAIPSAEGGIYEMMTNSRKTIHKSNVLILGFGRIAQHMTRILHAFGAEITVAARRMEQQAKVEAIGAKSCDFAQLAQKIADADFVVNTVPQQVLGFDELKNARKDVYLLDLASAPGGICANDAADCGLTVNWALALPAKYSPDTAGLYVLMAIQDIIKQNGGQL